MDEFLAFVDEVGRTIDGKYIYRFDFTVDTDTVWGDYFNVTPSVIVPDLQADPNSLSHRGRVTFPREMVIAKRNYCFSMQDCIDGIIPLIFSEIDDETLSVDDKPFFLPFGTSIEDVNEMLNKAGLEMTDLEEVAKGDNSAIDNLIDAIGDDEDADGEEDDPGAF